MRDFTGGEAVFNPLFNSEDMTRTFTEPHIQASTGLLGTSFVVPVGDGEIFLVAGPQSAADVGFESPDVAGVASNVLSPGWKLAATTAGAGVGLQDHSAAGLLGGEGEQHLALSDDGRGATITVDTAAPLGAVVADTHYVLTVALGNSHYLLEPGGPNAYKVSLLVDGDEAASLTLEDAESAIPDGCFADFSLDWNSPADGATIGGDIDVALTYTGVVGQSTRGVLDDVRLFASPLLPADFTADGAIDGADFLAWQRGQGMTSGATRADGDADGDGAVTPTDLAVWREAFGSAAAALAVGVPEPTAALWGVVAAVGVTRCRFRAPATWGGRVSQLQPASRRPAARVDYLTEGNRAAAIAFLASLSYARFHGVYAEARPTTLPAAAHPTS